MDIRDKREVLFKSVRKDSRAVSFESIISNFKQRRLSCF
jgi:hypothetical protein